MKNILSKLIFICIAIISWCNSANSQNVNCLAISGTNIFAGTETGLYQVTNNGNNWKLLGFENIKIKKLAISGTRVIVKGEDEVLFLSENNGTTWEKVKNIEYTNIYSFAINGENIFLSTNPGKAGMLLSSNNGDSWAKINKGLKKSSFESIFISGTTIYGVSEFNGVFFSIDNGGQWSSIKNIENYGITASAIGGSTVFIGDPYGTVFRSLGNADFLKSKKVWGRVASLAINSATVCAGTEYELNISTDNGTNWTTIKDERAKKVTSLAIDGTNIYAVFDGNLFLSMNNGVEWIPADKGFKDIIEAKAKIKEAKVKIAETKQQQDQEKLIESGRFQWWYSRPDGERILCFARSGNTIFVGTHSGVFLSTYKGVTWTAINNGLTDTTVVNSLAINGNTIFAATDEGVCLSRNNGSSWSPANKGLLFVDWQGWHGFKKTSVTSLAVIGDNIFASTQRGIFLSTDNGTSWKTMNNGLTDSVVYALVVKGNNIYAGTGNGLFLSTNNGTSWEKQVTNNITNEYYSLAFFGNDLIAGTYLSGFCTSSDNVATWTALQTEQKERKVEGTNEQMDIYVAPYLLEASAVFRNWMSYNRRMDNWYKKNKEKEDAKTPEEREREAYLNSTVSCSDCNGTGKIYIGEKTRTSYESANDGKQFSDHTTAIITTTTAGYDVKCIKCSGTGRVKKNQ